MITPQVVTMGPCPNSLQDLQAFRRHQKAGFEVDDPVKPAGFAKAEHEALIPDGECAFHFVAVAPFFGGRDDREPFFDFISPQERLDSGFFTDKFFLIRKRARRTRCPFFAYAPAADSKVFAIHA
jgi:hypothetical protein